MDDLERYGDYNDSEDDAPRSRNPVVLILKILIGVVCFAVVFLLGFRIVLFNSYPDSIENIYFNSTLKEYYNETDGNINAETQSLRAPYDHADEGNFFSDNLIVVKGADHLQISVRYNLSLEDTLFENYGVRVDLADTSKISFSLSRNPRGESKSPEKIGVLDKVIYESSMMYGYYKLVFDNVDFGLDDGEDIVNWIRVEIEIEGVEREEPFMIAIYEYNENFSKFEPYELGKDEVPN